MAVWIAAAALIFSVPPAFLFQLFQFSMMAPLKQLVPKPQNIKFHDVSIVNIREGNKSEIPRVSFWRFAWSVV